MIKQATSEQLLDDMAARNTAKVCCDQALAKTIKKLLAKAPTSAMVDTDAPEFSAEFADELQIVCQLSQGLAPSYVGRFISGGLIAEFSHDEIERFSIIITTEQITKEICWQQHQAPKKVTYL